MSLQQSQPNKIGENWVEEDYDNCVKNIDQVHIPDVNNSKFFFKIKSLYLKLIFNIRYSSALKNIAHKRNAGVLTVVICFFIVSILALIYEKQGSIAEISVTKGIKEYNNYPEVIKVQNSTDIKYMIMAEEAKNFLVSLHPEIRETWEYSEFSAKYNSGAINLVLPIGFDWEELVAQVESEFLLPVKLYTIQESRFAQEGEQEVMLVISNGTSFEYTLWDIPKWGKLPVQKGTYPIRN